MFYTDTYFLPHVVVGKLRWIHNLCDYDFVVIPAFVNSNHYVTFVASRTHHELVSYDSLGTGTPESVAYDGGQRNMDN